MKSPSSIKQIQSLIVLNRFVSKSSDNYKEFFKAIKGVGKNFVWITECEEAFQKIREHLGLLALLSKPLEGETLIPYLAVSNYSISSPSQGRSQCPVTRILYK